MHGEECVNISPPSISSIVLNSNELWLSPNFPKLCWLSAILHCVQTCQLSHFRRDCPTFWACKSKRKDSLTFLKFQWWQISLNDQQRMMSILHGIFTSAFSLVYCDRLSKLWKTFPQWIFLVLSNVHAHGFGWMSHFFTLVGWQVCNNFISNLWQ